MNASAPEPKGRIYALPVLAGILWLLLTLGLYRHAVEVDAGHRLELEHIRLATMAEQLMDARNWNAEHGGVYVPESSLGKPNPWLPESDRVLHTADGRTLVLLNPAYMSRQLAERISRPNTRIAVVGSNPLRPENKADAWETAAIEAGEQGLHEVFSHNIGEEPGTAGTLRLFSVLTAQPSCLRCHANRKEGDVLGGISVSLSAENFVKNAREQENNMRLLYLLLGVTGLCAVSGATACLTYKRRQAEESARMKSAFMARLSHDMRTPLTAVLGMCELLQRKDTDEAEKKRALRYLTRAGDSLLEMVSDITDHAALEQGVIQLNEADFSLREALHRCMDLYRPAAEAKNISLSMDIPDEVPDNLCGDSFRLRQALGNLISNAVKFTAVGGVHLSARYEMRAPQLLLLRLNVQDSGPGVPTHEREHIFESFRRGSGAEHAPGTGLGLNIARTIARRMGGDVRVISEPGKGSRFTLEMLLRSAVTGPEANGSSMTLQRGALAGRRILAAEDNNAGRYFLEQALRGEGADVRMAADGREALEALADGPWDLVLLDALMPGMSGLGILKRIRSGRAHVPAQQRVVIYTAALTHDQRRRYVELRADAVWLKPLTFARLRKNFAELFAVEEQATHNAPALNATDTRAQTQAAPAKEGATTMQDVGVWEYARALEGVAQEESLLTTLAEVLRKDLRQSIVQLNAAQAEGNAREVRRLAHACKNSAGTLCLERLRTAAARVEDAGEAASPADIGSLLDAAAEAADRLDAYVAAAAGTRSA